MKKSSRIVSAALATLMVGSTVSAGVVTASAATVKAPAKVKAVNVKNGIKITWKKAKGAKNYRVYRGKKLIAASKKNTYTDTKAKNGKKYIYTVKSVNGKKAKAAKKVSVYRLKAPTNVKAKNDQDAVKISWKDSTSAKHMIYKKADGSKYTLLKKVDASKKSFTDTALENGKKYSYKIKSYIGKSVSVASAAASIEFVAAVEDVKTEIKVQDNTTTTTLTWKKNPLATSYKVYKQDLKGNKTSLGTVKDTTITDTITDANPKIYAYVITAVIKEESTPKGVAVIHLPKGCYTTDAEGNVNVNLSLEKGQAYDEGVYLFTTFAFVGSMKDTLAINTEVVEGADVVKINEYGSLTATAEGTAKIKVTLGKDAVKIINESLAGITNGNFKNKLETGVAYVNVTVK